MIFLELKPLTAELLPAVVELDKLCFGGHWTLEGYRRELTSPTSSFLIVSLKSANLISPLNSQSENTEQNPTNQLLLGLGCFWSILEEAHITLLAIHPSYQRQGLGQLLFCALLQKARMQGLERSTLEVGASNQAALSLYKKLGFQEAGRRRHYYDTGEDALILWRSGLGTDEFAKILEVCDREISSRIVASGWHLLKIGINPQEEKNLLPT